MERETVTSAEAARRLGVSGTTIARMVLSGELEGYKLRPGVRNSPLRVYVDSVDRVLAARRG